MSPGVESQVLDRRTERNLVRSGDEVWLCDSLDDTVPAERLQFAAIGG